MLPEDIHLVQVHLEDLKDQELPVDNLEGPVVIHQDHQDFQDAQAVLNQVGSSLPFHRVKDLPVDILVDDRQFHFRAVNQQEDQEQVPVKVYQVDQVDDQRDFRQDQAVAILVADLVGKHREGFQVDKDLPDSQAVGPAKGNQKVPDIPAVGRVDKDQVEDIPADKLLEVIPVEHRSLVAREVDILVEGREPAILEVLKDLAVVQVLKNQADILEVLEVLEVSKAQVKYLPAAILVLDQERKDQKVTQVAQDRKGRAVIRVDQARRDQKDIQVDQEEHKGQKDIQVDQGEHKDQEAIQAAQVRKDQEEFQVDQLRKDQEDFQVDQERKAQEDSQADQDHKAQEDFQVDQERKGREDFQVDPARKDQEDSQALVIR